MAKAKAREEKVQAMLNRMGDQIDTGKEKERMRKQEQDYIRDCIAADAAAKERIRAEKELAKSRAKVVN